MFTRLEWHSNKGEFDRVFCEVHMVIMQEAVDVLGYPYTRRENVSGPCVACEKE